MILYRRFNNIMTLENIYNDVINGNALGVESGVQAALSAGEAPEKILKDALISAMTEVGKRFEEGEFFVPEMLIAARAMQVGLRLLKPQLVEGGVEAAGQVAIGTVKGDLHDIGKNLVAMMLEGAGYEVNDLGVDVDSDTFVQAARDGAQVIAMSALLTTTMSSMKGVLEALEAAGLRNQIKTIIGGAPVTQSFADQIGADGFASDASAAVRVVSGLV
jgi:5-methyltetrahydrofolate--homocysteine methyltransferase